MFMRVSNTDTVNVKRLLVYYNHKGVPNLRTSKMIFTTVKLV